MKPLYFKYLENTNLRHISDRRINIINKTFNPLSYQFTGINSILRLGYIFKLDNQRLYVRKDMEE